MKLYRTLLCTFVLAGIASAQPVSAGLKIGVPFTDAFQNQPYPTVATLTASSNAYTIGAFLEIKLPARFSVEGDVLYRGLHFNNVVNSASTGQWDFPIVAKYKLFKGPVKPYIEGGLDFSHISDIKNLVTATHTSNFGIVLGAGVEIHALVLRISPEIRYTGDVLKSFDNIVSSNRNQLAFLVGFGF